MKKINIKQLVLKLLVIGIIITFGLINKVLAQIQTPQTEIPLTQAIADGLITVEIKGNNALTEFKQPLLAMQINKLTATSLTLLIEQGMIFESEDPRYANMILFREENYTLTDNSVRIGLLVYSLDPQKAFPEETIKYSIGPSNELEDNQLKEIMNRIIAEGKKEDFAGQVAVWMSITNNDFDELQKLFKGRIDLEKYQRDAEFLHTGHKEPTTVPISVVLGGLFIITAMLTFLVYHFYKTSDLPYKFGDYKVVKKLAEGGQYNVYLAKKQKEPYVVKVPKDHQPIERTELEINLRKQLDEENNNIVPMITNNLEAVTNRKKEKLYFVEKFIEGGNLRQLLKKQEKLEQSVVLEISQQVLKALKHIHSKGITHRDLKPSNILIDTQGLVYLTDFGTAKGNDIENLSELTKHYLNYYAWFAPEVLERAYLYDNNQPNEASRIKIGKQADIYSLGVVIYYVLTGKFPFDWQKRPKFAETPHLDFDSSNIPKHIQDAIKECLTVDPNERAKKFKDADALAIKLGLSLNPKDAKSKGSPDARSKLGKMVSQI